MYRVFSTFSVTASRGTALFSAKPARLATQAKQISQRASLKLQTSLSLWERWRTKCDVEGICNHAFAIPTLHFRKNIFSKNKIISRWFL